MMEGVKTVNCDQLLYFKGQCKTGRFIASMRKPEKEKRREWKMKRKGSREGKGKLT